MNFLSLAMCSPPGLSAQTRLISVVCCGLRRISAGANGPDGGREGGDVVGAVVASTVDEKGRCAGNAAEVGAIDVLGDSGGGSVLS